MSFLLFFALLLQVDVWASHLRAADIVATRIGDKSYRILLTIYTDAESVTDGGGDVPAGEAMVMVAGEELVVGRTLVKNIGNGTFQNEYEFEYEFPATNRNYDISYTGIFRNNGILNIKPPSDQKSLYVETFVQVDAFTQLNATPRLLLPPIDLANVGQVYTHNPGAWDPDGDSISFKLLVPRKAAGSPVDDYRFPGDPSLGGGSLTLNPITGDLVWDSPVIPGEYNVAFMVEEWRSGVRIGYVVRDMQIIVEDSDNIKPELILPKDTCIGSGERLEEQIIAWDPNHNSITLTFQGALPFLGATLVQDRIRNDSIEAIFNWTPSCDRVRIQPYAAIFKVEDNHPVNLVTIKTWLITVVGEAPKNLSAQRDGRTALLEWDLYNCQNAKTINIWRASCDTGQIVRSACLSGVPVEWGYELIAQVPVTDTRFVDTNKGLGLSSGGKFCYLITAGFPKPEGGESYASNPACVSLALEVPIITRVSVDESAINGKITLAWLPPNEFDAILYPAPYTYKIFRSEGLKGADFGTMPIQEIITEVLKDTFIVDLGINTKEKAYSYRVDLYSGNTFVSSSLVATSVWLEAGFKLSTIILNWQNNSFWSDVDTTFDRIWETFPRNMILIDSTRSFINAYTVTGLINGNEYCYYVDKRYSICNDSIFDVFESKSNIVCAIPIDTIPPCPPILSIAPLNCDIVDFFLLENTLTWENKNTAACNDNIASYDLYFKKSLVGDFALLAQVLAPNQKYVHEPLTTQVGCYGVVAIDEFGNRSSLSNIVCQDNCDSLNLPNIFTPNGDGSNEFFVPIPPTRFVESIDFKVINRWGKEVYHSDEFKDIRWDGKDTHGNELSDGIYYYQANVTFDKLKKEEATRRFKGWVMIVH